MGKGLSAQQHQVLQKFEELTEVARQRDDFKPTDFISFDIRDLLNVTEGKALYREVPAPVLKATRRALLTLSWRGLLVAVGETQPQRYQTAAEHARFLELNVGQFRPPAADLSHIVRRHH